MKAPPGRLRPFWPLVSLACWAIGALVFFHRPVFSGFDFITGDNGDTRLIIYLHEHWVQVFQGISSWRDPGFFYPTADALGYSDTFILNEIFYAPLRWCGLDMFLAFQWTLISTSLVGFAGALCLCRRILPEHWAICIPIALTFTFSNMLYVQAGHSQLYSVYWLPIVLLLLSPSGEARPGHLKAFAAGLLLGLLFLSTYYVAWFFVLCSVLWVVTFALVSGRAIRSRKILLDATRAYRSRALTFAAGLLIGVIPFLVVYLPILGFGGRSYGVAMSYAAEPRDIINTGRSNYFWGPLTRHTFNHSPRLTNGELGFGLTPVTLIVLALGTGYSAHRVRVTHGIRTADRVALTTAITAVVTIVLPMKFFGVSAWFVVWILVPGASAIRAIDRLGVITGLLAPLVVAFVIADILRRSAPKQRARRNVVAACLLIVGVMTIEQFNIGRNAGLDRTGELAALAAVPAPPSTCRSFFLVTPTGHPPPAYVSSIDAMLISQAKAIPTVNGFSGQYPPGYGSLADPGSAAYQRDVRSWIAANGIAAGMCENNVTTASWQRYP